MRIARYDKFQIGVEALLMAQTKTVPLGAKRRFGVSPEDEASSRLRECKIEVRTQSAMDGSELLSDKRRNIYLRLAGRGLFACWQFESDAKGRLSVSVGLNGSKKSILGPRGYISHSERRTRSHAVVISCARKRRFDFQLQTQGWRVRNA